MITTIKRTSFNNEIELSLSYDDIEDIYIVFINVVYYGRFIFTLLEQKLSSKCNAAIAYDEKYNQIERLYTKF